MTAYRRLRRVQVRQTHRGRVPEQWCVHAGSPCQVTRHVDILGVDMPGAGGGLKTFGIVVHDKAGEIITEYSQLEAADLEPWMRYMVRSCA